MFEIGSVFLDFMFVIVKFLAIVSIPFILPVIFNIVYQFLKGRRRIKGEYRYVGYGSIFKKIFIEFPKRFTEDFYNRNPDEFRDFGVHLICGKQGSGKSITLTYLLLRYQKMYPKIKIKTNMAYKYQDAEINSYKDILEGSNGIYGEVDVIDEIQNWFNSLQSKDFPVEMLTEITQQRKQKKIIFGTAQVFNRVAKPIREQTYLIYEPHTFFGCFTWVRKYEPSLNSDGSVEGQKYRGCFFFIHNDLVRNAFDTYKKIMHMSKQGFKPFSEQIRNSSNTVFIEKK